MSFITNVLVGTTKVSAVAQSYFAAQLGSRAVH